MQKRNCKNNYQSSVIAIEGYIQANSNIRFAKHVLDTGSIPVKSPLSFLSSMVEQGYNCVPDAGSIPAENLYCFLSLMVEHCDLNYNAKILVQIW